MSTAQEVVAQALRRCGLEQWHDDCADAVLSALREHWTSDEEIKRVDITAVPRTTWRIIAALLEEEA